MEIELKYMIPDDVMLKDMWQEDVFGKYGTVDRNTAIDMDATYYDTAEGDLSRVDAAFRIRKEGASYVATLKWADSVDDSGLFEREELNIHLDDRECKRPTLRIFSESESCRKLIDIVDDKPLLPIIKTDFKRHIMRIDAGTSIFEADLDIGKILAGGEELEIRELELELYSGGQTEMEKAGSDIAARFGLVPGVKSKYQRGLEALCKERNK